MDLEKGIEKYLQTNKTTAHSVKFLTKLWNSSSIKTSEKYGIILTYFTKNLLPVIIGEVECHDEIKSFLKLKHPVNAVIPTLKKDLISALTEAINDSSDINLADSCFEITSNESFKDYFKVNLKLYSKFLLAMIKCYIKTIESEQNNDDLFSRIIAEMYCYAKMEKFKNIFLEHLLCPFSKASKLSSVDNKKAALELCKTIFFSNPSMSGSTLDVFNQELTEEQESILVEAFIVSYETEPEELGKLLTLINEHPSDEEFLSKIRKVLHFLQTNNIDLSSVKKQDPELLTQLTSRLHVAIESSRKSTDFAQFIETLSSLISYDAFLFDKNIYQIIMDCMLQEKSSVELTNYENLLNNVLKIYGQDMNQFMKKLLKSIDEKLEVFTIPKKRKRKISVSPETERDVKKLKTDGIDKNEWPSSTANHFTEIVAALNVAQTIKVWKQLECFLVSVLNDIKLSSVINENVLFKIEFVSELLSELFNSTRLHEQLMNKKKEISSAIESFHTTRELFNEVILNVEYNSRVMNSFLNLLYNYENFLALFFYHHTQEVKSEIDSVFIDYQVELKDQLKKIEKRVKKNGKANEINRMNALMIQQRQKEQLFDNSSTVDSDNLSSILEDNQQVEFLMSEVSTRSFLLNCLSAKELKYFAQYLINLKDEKLKSAVLHEISHDQRLLDGIVAELVVDSSESSLKSIEQLPLDCASDETKKKVFGELTKQNYLENLQPTVENIICKLFRNDSYKLFFKDFTMEEVGKAFEFKSFSKIYHSILSCAARKLNVETLQNFNWIVTNNDHSLHVLAKVAAEVPMTPASGVTAEAINTMKANLISKLMESFEQKGLKKVSEDKCKEFVVLAKMCSENHAVLKDDVKTSYATLLQTVIKIIIKSPNAEGVKLLLMTLKDVKKLNINEETRDAIVESLLVYLKSTLEKRMLSDTDYQEVALEKQLFEALKPFKGGFQEGCVQVLRQILATNPNLTNNQLVYSFKIYQLAFSCVDKASNGIVKSYIKFLEDFSANLFSLNCSKLIIQALETNNTVLADNKFQLDNTTVDEMLCLIMDPRVNASDFNIEDFCKFHDAVGETLFVIANFRQNYFKSRISQYFIIYQAFMNSVYFYKNEKPEEELSPVEISLLLKLTLQLENIMKTVMKQHSISIKVISPYILSAIVNIFVKNPKTLSVGYKFKVNIKNICYQLLSTFDDKTRKHVYSVTDETTRDVFDGLFNEVRRN